MLSKVTVEATKSEDNDKSHDNKNGDGEEEGVTKAA